MPRPVFIATLLASALLGGCDMIGGALGIQSPEKLAAARDADGKAIGGACRHAGRAIEDCYTLNKKADRAAVFSGWRDMNDYMRENKIDAVAPQLSPSNATQLANAGSKAAAVDDAKADAKSEAKSDIRSDAKADTNADAGNDKSAAKPRDAAKARVRETAKAHHS